MNVQDWRPIIRRIFGGIWCYVALMILWAVAAHIWDDRIPAFAWVAVWVPFQWVAWACGGWFLLVAGAWGVQEATAAARGVWVRLRGHTRHAATHAAPTRVLVPTTVVTPTVQRVAQFTPQDRPTVTLAQLVYDHMQTRPNHGGRAQELLEEMREAGLFVLAGVPEPVDAADLSRQLDEAGWPKLPDKRRVGYPGMATGFRHVDQVDFDERVTFHPVP